MFLTRALGGAAPEPPSSTVEKELVIPDTTMAATMDVEAGRGGKPAVPGLLPVEDDDPQAEKER